jgi:hypothetical protein
MKILPASIEARVATVDRQRGLYFAIVCGLVAFWSLYRVAWSLYLSTTFGFAFGSLIFPIVLWGVIGVVGGIAAVAFGRRYATQS